MDTIADCLARGDTRQRALAQRQPCPGTATRGRVGKEEIWDAAATVIETRCWGLGWLHGYNKWCCVMRLTSQSAPLLSRILNCWDLSTTPQPRYTLRHEQNSNSILSRVDIVKIFIHCKNIRGCRVSCLLEHNWGAAACGLLLLLGCGEILIYLIANVATDTVTSRGRPALYHHLTLPQLRNPP